MLDATPVARIRQNRCVAWIMLICGLVALAGCGTSKEKSAGAPGKDPLWAEFIAFHTGGVVSRTAPIRVTFATDVVAEDRIGKDAGATLSVIPQVEASIAFASRREIVVTPKTELSPGETYRVVVKPVGLSGVPAKLEPFEFLVQVKKPEFDVSMGGFTTDSVADHTMALNGVVATADSERADRIEKMLVATYADKPVMVAWEHSADGQRHPFAIRALKRGNQDQNLKLAWNGQSIGAPITGERELKVPAKDRFIVTLVTAAEDGGQRHIRVFFSDTLDPQQDFRGLVRLSAGNATTRVDGNVLRVYTDQAADGKITLSLEPGIRNREGEVLEAGGQYPVTFSSVKPQVRFVGRGTILPDAKQLTIPFEAVNVRSVRVAAFQVYENNLTQFLQVNALDGASELGRVGRNLWRKTIPLTAADLGQWNRYSLDATELLKKYPGGLIRLTLSINRGDSTYTCPGQAPVAEDKPLVDQDSGDVEEASNWDYAEDYYNIEDGSDWSDRDNPCKDAYYTYNQQIKGMRNMLVSNIGLLAKKDKLGRWIVVATDLRSTEPLSGVNVDVLNYQNQRLTSVTTDGRGMADFTLKDAAFTLVANKQNEKGYLKVNAGVALPVSHFDVGGEVVTAGLKGFIYGERGVWRPGDDIYLTFVLQDKDRTLPAQHPVTMELFNPQSQLVQTLVNTTPVNGFYAFKLRTDEDAPTGNWTAKATLGGTSFTKALKIETVMPNRLKMTLDLEHDAHDTLRTVAASCTGAQLCDEPAKIRGELSSQWLTGATAAGLKADVKFRLTPTATHFDRFNDYVFEDPARTFASEPQELFEGELDAQGHASFSKTLDPIEGAPGMLSAAFTSRVFERGGAYSINFSSYGLSPYQRYVGLKLPKGDVARGMLQTDTLHTVELATVSPDGKPVSVEKLEVTLYKVEWKWWWDKSGDSLAQYAQRDHASVVQQSTVSSKDGKAQWQFEVKYPAWGRYLIRACDTEGGHCTGRTFYIDWPMWAGRAQDQSGPAANVLVFTADKEQYVVGDTATLLLPETKEGRALLTIESGSAILDARWIDLAHDSNRVTLPITAAMAPTVYASVTLIQPHAKTNDRPIRMYGVIPIHVSDPQTILQPIVDVAAEWKPNSVGSVEVSERNKREMTYTLAVVDEGLLDLTSFRTPDLHAQFYKREALGVMTWDLFDEVAGAYAADLERLLALGGSDGGPVKNPEERKTRFPPVVTFMGPFELKAGATAKHEVNLPQYIGAVRVMVVAGDHGAYGSADKSVFVRQPLMMLPTLPRVVGPEEEVAVPMSIFVSDPSIRQVSLAMTSDSQFEIAGEGITTLQFTQPGEQLGMLRLKSRAGFGKGLVKFVATSGKHRAEAQVYLDVRSPNAPSTVSARKTLEPGESWDQQWVPHGLAGTNVVTLEVSAVPPLDLERRLHYLIMYPYGCLEQTTSSVFPQLYLPSLVKLEDERKAEIQRNVQDGIHRLSGFQLPNGAFAYWPGGGFWPDAYLRDTWSTTYAGHFLVEAKKLGYSVPDAMLSDWVRFQRTTAQSWAQSGSGEGLDQAYRLYTLALAGQPEIGAMNRLRERSDLPATGRWMLASAYKLAGLPEAANDIAGKTPRTASPYAGREQSFGSDLRDNAIVLTSLVQLGRRADADALAQDVSRELASDSWYSTHSTAYGLMAMAHYAGLGQLGDYSFRQSINGKATNTKVSAPMYSTRVQGFPDKGAQFNVTNTSNRRLFVTLLTRGIPRSGGESAGAAGLSMHVRYRDEDGESIAVDKLAQGTDLIAQIVITNDTGQRIDNIALAQLIPAGWEIHNERLEGVASTGERNTEEVARPWWWDGSPGATAANVERIDIRDDRIYRHFSLKPRESITFTTRLNAAYRGRFYLPGVAVEAMYDATRYARSAGQWVEVVDQSGH
ncbi:MAG TPA: MG2 domain-containing protein [Povalibacter sp.]|nr:MG2 domain-containing protein [Povalibacter sp.]